MPATGRTSDSREFENGEPAARPFRDSTGPALPYVPALDGLRAVAIVLVMGFHFGIDLHGTDAFSRAFRHLRIGFMGVDIFFVLSGTLITLLIAREISRHGRLDVKRFYQRRALRLLPGAFALVAAAGVFVALRPRDAASSDFGVDALATIFYSSNWVWARVDFFQGHVLSHTWSLAIEEQFYLLWPAALFLVLRAGRVWMRYVVVAAGATACFATLLWGERHGWTDQRVFYGTDTRGGSLLLGCLLGLVLASGYTPTSRTVRRCIGWCAWAGVAVVLAMLALPAKVDQPEVSTLVIPAAFATAAIVLAVFVQPSGTLSRVLSVRPLVWVGRLSYSLYLWHFPMYAILRSADHPTWSALELVTVRIGLAFAFAMASFYGFERFALQRKARLRPRV